MKNLNNTKNKKYILINILTFIIFNFIFFYLLKIIPYKTNKILYYLKM